MLQRLMIFTALVFALSACKSTETTDTPQTEPTVAAPTTEAPKVESTPMDFAGGSDSGKIAGLQTVNFEFDKSSLSANAKKKIKSNADWMKANANTKVQIEGHCDARGSIEYNVALGERRANAVKSYMVSLGIPADRLSTISYGKEKPLDSGDSESAWAKNRRANFQPVN